MPGFNAKGPKGEGPRTGRGLGRCKTPSNVQPENSAPDNQGTQFGGGRQFRGTGTGNQGGRGMRGGRGRNM
jgi:hypothetical protein